MEHDAHPPGSSPSWEGLDYLEIFNASSSMMAFTEFATGKIMDVNATWSRITGFSREHSAGKTALELDLWVHPGDRRHCLEEITRNGHVTEQEVALNIRNSTCPYAITGSSLGTGQHKYILWEMKDISARKQAENALVESQEKVQSLLAFSEQSREALLCTLEDEKRTKEALMQSEQHLRTLINTIPDLIWLKDTNGVYLQCNHRFEDFFGAPEKDVVGKTDFDFTSKELATFFRDKDKLAMEVGKPTINEELVTFKDGHEEFLETIKTPLYDLNGKIVGILGVGRDITQRKKTEEKLLESEYFLSRSQLVGRVGSYILSIPGKDEAGQTWRSSQAMDDIFGIDQNYPRTGDSWLALIVNHKEVSQHFNDIVFTRKTKFEMEYQIRRPSDGEKRWIHGHGELEFNDQGIATRMFGTVQDITERKQTEIELKNYRDHLEQLVKERTDALSTTNEELYATNDELYSQREELEAAMNKLNDTQKQLIQSEKMASLGVLSAGIAHEINNPLNFINGGYLGIKKYITNNLPGHVDQLLPLLDAISVGVDRASKIVSSLSHYSHRDNLAKDDCDIHSIINNCLVMLHNQMKNKVEIRKNYTDGNHVIAANEGQLHQVFLNILSNAEQAIENNGIIDITTSSNDDKFTITITDSGCGIDPNDIPKIFDPFFTTKPPGKGTGLGLSITYTIIQEHDGTIEFESQLGKGTKVFIKLPANHIETL